MLGISPNATDEQVKIAYRELAKKYHPDNYANNPLSDLAEEKMQEINQAYDAIVAQRRAGHSAGGQTGAGAYSGASQFSDIRRMINAGRLAEAQELLDGVAAANRDAEWHFLKGSIYYSRGWLDDALQCFQRACQLNPQNSEYRIYLAIEDENGFVYVSCLDAYERGANGGAAHEEISPEANIYNKKGKLLYRRA